MYEDNNRPTPVPVRKDLVAQMDAEMKKHSKVLGFTLTRQQFIEMLLNNWRDK